jgi:hypothetical protein
VLKVALLRGSHKSAKTDEVGLAALLIDDVKRGYTLPLPLDQVRNIPGRSLQPMGILPFKVNEQNTIVSKKGLTHDSTFAVLETRITLARSNRRAENLCVRLAENHYVRLHTVCPYLFCTTTQPRTGSRAKLVSLRAASHCQYLFSTTTAKLVSRSHGVTDVPRISA